jgi:hypothetical protein
MSGIGPPGRSSEYGMAERAVAPCEAAGRSPTLGATPATAPTLAVIAGGKLETSWGAEPAGDDAIPADDGGAAGMPAAAAAAATSSEVAGFN